MKLPNINLNDFPEYAAESEKMLKLEIERRTARTELAAVEAEIAASSAQTMIGTAREYLNSGHIPDAELAPLRKRRAGLLRHLTILGEAKRQQGEKISKIIAGIRTQLRQRYKADYGKLARRRILTLCEAGLIQADIEEFADHLTALHPDFSGIFGPIHGRINSTLRSNNEGLANLITLAIEAEYLTIKDVPKEVSDVLGIPAKMKALAALGAWRDEKPEDRKARVEAELPERGW